MEEMNARVMENEELDEIAEVDEISESGNAGALVAGIAGGFLAYAMIGGVKKLWGIVGSTEGSDRSGGRGVRRSRQCGRL